VLNDRSSGEEPRAQSFRNDFRKRGVSRQHFSVKDHPLEPQLISSIFVHLPRAAQTHAIPNLLNGLIHFAQTNCVRYHDITLHVAVQMVLVGNSHLKVRLEQSELVPSRALVNPDHEARRSMDAPEVVNFAGSLQRL
jgi:hypothetical protein